MKNWMLNWAIQRIFKVGNRELTIVPYVVGGGFSFFTPRIKHVENRFHGRVGRLINRAMLDVRMVVLVILKLRLLSSLYGCFFVVGVTARYSWCSHDVCSPILSSIILWCKWVFIRWLVLVIVHVCKYERKRTNLVIRERFSRKKRLDFGSKVCVGTRLYRHGFGTPTLLSTQKPTMLLCLTAYTHQPSLLSLF